MKKRFHRRELLKDSVIAGGVGAAVGAAAYFGLNFIGNNLRGILAQAEREVRELALDVRELSGSLERKLVQEREQLEEHYTQGILKIYEELGIATPAEIAEIDKIIENYEEFEQHYNFAERARIFKDRIDRRLLALDETLESYQPESLRSINDAIRRAFGKPTGEEGMKQRKQIKERLEVLCAIYDTNSNNKIAQTEVLKTLNNYLENAELSEEEKGLYEFLKQEAQKGNEENIRHFINNYDSYSVSQDVLLKLRASLSEAEGLYGKIQENKSYIINLQDLLKQGIALKQEAREKSTQKVAHQREYFDKKIAKLHSSLDNVIRELNQRGYDIETREEFISRGSYARALDAMVTPVVTGGSLFFGTLAGLFAFRERTKGRKVRALNKALGSAVDDYNDLANKCNIEKDKNSDIPNYSGGNDIY